MPELPEVEVTRLRLERELAGKRVEGGEIRAPKLRLPIPPDLPALLAGVTVHAVTRRGKYLLFDCGKGTLIVHLGMTGFLRVAPVGAPPGKHDHLELFFEGGRVLRFHDPRKFGTVVWTEGDPLQHRLLAGIGPEPLAGGFNGEYLHRITRRRKVAIKQLIMNSSVVAGIGNIYANEALFRACIRPDRPACSLSVAETDRLVAMIREVLEESVEAGSTFRVAEETVSYHPLNFNVYGRRRSTCLRCSCQLQESRLGNRSTVWCPRCQK